MRRRDGFLLVRVGGNRYGLPLAQIRATADLERIQPVPAGFPPMLGIASVGGRIVPVIHLEALLTGDRVTPVSSATVILAHIGHRTIAFAVDDVERVRRDQWIRVPPGQDLPWAQGIVRDPDGLVPVIDVEKLGERLSGLEESAA